MTLGVVRALVYGKTLEKLDHLFSKRCFFLSQWKETVLLEGHLVQ